MPSSRPHRSPLEATFIDADAALSHPLLMPQKSAVEEIDRQVVSMLGRNAGGTIQRIPDPVTGQQQPCGHRDKPYRERRRTLIGKLLKRTLAKLTAVRVVEILQGALDMFHGNTARKEIL